MGDRVCEAGRREGRPVGLPVTKADSLATVVHHLPFIGSWSPSQLKCKRAAWHIYFSSSVLIVLGFLCIIKLFHFPMFTTDVLPPVPGQGDKTATMLSDGAIYSSIDFTTKTTYNSSSQITQATPYATTQILHSNSIHELAVDLPDPQWKSSIQQKTDLMGFGYSLPDQNKGNNGKSSSYFQKSYFHIIFAWDRQ